MILVAKQAVYRTLEGQVFQLDDLPWPERAFYDRLRAYYKTSPSHEEFSFYWRSEGEQVWGHKTNKEVAKSGLFTICQDLDARIAIKEGHEAPPERPRET